MKDPRAISTLLLVVSGISLASPTFAQDAAQVVRYDPDSLRPLSVDRWDRAATAHLLRRAGYSGTPVEVDKLWSMGLESAVSHLVDFDRIEWRTAPPMIPSELYQPADRTRFRSLSDRERRELFEQRRRLERGAFEETRLWWLERMALSPRPFEEKMTLFWHGHFTSGMREVRDAIFMKDQNELLRRYALANFADLLQAVSRDRAMLVYLDGARNEKDHPNENYARELLELFTLGEGSYTEADVLNAARAFTGWGYDRFGFVFRRARHDFGDKRFLGRTGRLGGDDVIETILRQPACAEFLSRKLLTHFVRPDPSVKLVRAFAAQIRRHQYEMRPIMRSLFLSEAFYHPAARGALVKSPAELVIGSSRMLGAPIVDLRAAERAMAAMGQELMQPPNVKGWRGERGWINTATLFTRYNTITGLIHGDRRSTRQSSDRSQAERENDEMMFELSMREGMMEARSRITRAAQPPFDPRPWIRDYQLRSAEEVVDFFAAHLLAVSLDERKREHLVRYLAGKRGESFDPAADAVQDRIRTTIALLCSTPEFQMY